MSNPKNNNLKLKAARISIVVGIALLALKTFAWRLTGSAAVLSDAAESTINVVASVFAYWSIRVSALPADENHPYGHGKIEYFSAGFEGALIVMAALAILAAAIPGLFAPPALATLGWGMGITGFAAVINAVLGLYLMKVGRAERSLAIEADGIHLMTDVVTSAGVVGGLLLVKITGWNVLDPIVAILLALHILVSGYRLVRSAAGRLLDEADDKLLGQIVDALNEQRQPGDLQPHQLRAINHGSSVAMDFHLFLPRFWDLTRVHGRIDEIELALQRGFSEELEAIIHVDPCAPRHCRFCAMQDCELRRDALVAEEEWSLAAIKSSGFHPDFES